MDLEQRVVELESRLAFQDDTIAALNDELVEQQRLIERMQVQMKELARRLEEGANQFGLAEGDALPPHY
ncbi:SlyX family protein [Pseudomonas sp. zbq_18]|uniref:SlyX family protein n=1 Tax=Pseudomonas sp. zbq_18 TaxID=3367251 RepID=UPI00370CE31F